MRTISGALVGLAILVSACESTVGGADHAVLTDQTSLAAARPAGLYDVTYLVLARNNVDANSWGGTFPVIGETYSRVWQMDPTCGQGPCDINSDLAFNPANGGYSTSRDVFAYHDGIYSESTTDVEGYCDPGAEGNGWNVSRAFQITPTKARRMLGQLVVTEFTGSVVITGKATSQGRSSGCSDFSVASQILGTHYAWR